MKKFVWPLLVIFFLVGGLVAILIGQVVLPPEPRPESVETISEKWTKAGHSDSESVSFTYWDQRDPPEIPANCAKCHSAYGYLDFLGEDGSEANSVDAPTPIGSVVSCVVCHNPSGHEKDTTLFPSGAEINGLGMTANCAECHQGRRSSQTVENAIIDLPQDEVNKDLSFINVHYRVGGATRFGSDVSAGYQYPDKSYDGFFPHVGNYEFCTDCHDPHSLAITPSECAACHPVVTNLDNLRDIREAGTPDFDGDSDITEGINGEITTLHELLYHTIQTYANEVVGQPILYDNHSPQWYIDTNGNGEADAGEINSDNPYESWTPRLVKATYNYHLVVESAGGFVHNPKYVIQLLYDTLDDLSAVVPVDIANFIRPD